MGKIILTMQISLDGIVSDVDEWMSLSDEIVEASLAYYQTLDAIIIGGRTYPSLAEYWQNAEQSSDSELERRFAKKINEIEKIVISRSNVDLTWENSRPLLIRDEESLINEIKKLRNMERKNISVESGAGIWKLFVKHAIFDEMLMWVHPVIVGQGENLFDSVGSKTDLHLNSSKVYPHGVVGLHYQKRY